MISVSNLGKYAGGKPLFSGVSFQIYPGEKIGLVGPNGAGKTTLLRLLVGEERGDEGAISIQSGLRIAYFSQSVGEMRGRSALQEVMAGNARVGELAARLRGYEERLCDPQLEADEMTAILEKMGDEQTEFEKLGGFETESNAQTILSGLGIGAADQGKPVEDFSSGWKMRIALARVLIVMPDLILMDEPTNYLDMETIIWLEEWLRNFKGAILMTTHDREFMNRVVTRIVEVANGRVMTFSGNYDLYESEKAVLRRQNEAQYERQQSMLKKEEDFIARFKARASHAAQVQSRVKMIGKIERVELESDPDQMCIELPEIPRGGNDVIMIRDLAKSWPDSTGTPRLVFSGLSAAVHRQDRIAVVGVNGAGKSTFLRVLCRQTEPSAGEAVIGPSISTGYFGQSSINELDGEATVLEEVHSRLPQFKEASLRNLLASFLFRGEDVFKKIRYLSGGEKTRVVLAHLLSSPFNCLILDEPTNHLDIGSREVLLDALQRYQGTLLLVSHDRYFLRALVNRVFEVDHGIIRVHDGDYRWYLENRKA